MSARGVFITLEGGEGVGKSTQLSLLADTLTDAGFVVTVVREPGGTVVGEMVREVLLDPAHETMSARTELLLYEASRAQLVKEVIRPALITGGVVLCDRFDDSTTAYQGYGRGLPIDEVRAINSFATEDLEPDLTIVLDLGVKTGLARATAGGADRLEAEERAFHERVRAGFLRIAEDEPDRVKVVDAAGTVEEVAEAVLAAVHEMPVMTLGLRAES